MFFSQITHPYESLRAEHKNKIFIFPPALFPAPPNLAKCETPPLVAALGWGSHFARFAPLGPCGELRLRRWYVSSPFSSSFLFFFFPFFSGLISLSPLSYFPQRALEPNSLCCLQIISSSEHLIPWIEFHVIMKSKHYPFAPTALSIYRSICRNRIAKQSLDDPTNPPPHPTNPAQTQPRSKDPA